jgi:hypothetical protein
MSIVDFTQDDLNRGKLVDPGNYILEIGELNEGPSKGGDSTNIVYENSRIIANADNGDTSFAGVPLYIRFNSKAKGFMIGFFSALKGEAVTSADRFDTRAPVGKKIIAKDMKAE